MPRRRPDRAVILISLIILSLAVFISVGTYFAVFRFLAELNFLNVPAAMLSILLAILFTSTFFVLLTERDDPRRTLTWLLVLLAVPVFGFIFYLVFGQRLIRRQKVIRRLRQTYGQTGPIGRTTLRLKTELPHHYPDLPSLTEETLFPADSIQTRMGRLIYNSNGSSVTSANQIRILNDGIRIFPAMLAAISGATHHIHLETYIFRDDDLGGLFFDLLARKAAEGVQVRIIADGLGSLWMNRARLGELEDLGIHVKIHFPIRFTLYKNRLNYRNHRKILVVDGQTGFVGGANIGNDYLGLYPEIGNWRDTQLLIRGPAVTDLQRIFFQDWITLAGSPPEDDPGLYYPGFDANVSAAAHWTETAPGATSDHTVPDATSNAADFPAYAACLDSVLGVISRLQVDSGPTGYIGSGDEANAEGDGGTGSDAATDDGDGTSSDVMTDCGVLVSGDLVSDVMPVDDCGAGENSPAPHFRPNENKAVQIAVSGPDSPYESIMQLYHYAISSAKETINITSPYFIPNQSIFTALKTAALAGIDVNLLVPRNADHQMVYLAAMTYYDELMEDGVKVWLYHKGFLHSKIVTVDDSIAIIGTANMDQRSFALNFEVNAIVYDKQTVEELNAAFHRDVGDADLLDLQELRRHSLPRKILESSCRLLSPLL